MCIWFLVIFNLILRESPICVCTRSYKTFDESVFLADLQKAPWEQVESYEDPNGPLKQHRGIQDQCNKHNPRRNWNPETSTRQQIWEHSYPFWNPWLTPCVHGPFQVKYKTHSTSDRCRLFNYQNVVDEDCPTEHEPCRGSRDPSLDTHSTSNTDAPSTTYTTELEDHTGKYLIVNVKGKKSVKRYACFVLQSSRVSREVEVRFLIKVKSCPGDATFVFSDEGDFWVPQSDILEVLPTPFMATRGDRHRDVFP